MGRTAADTVEAIIAREIKANSDAVSAAEEWKKCEPWTVGFSEANCTKRITAADTVDAIIAREVGSNSDGMSGGVEWKKVGSRTSVCSDNTSDTLSADEGQRDEDDTRPRRVRPEETSGRNVGGTVLPAVVDHIRNGCGAPGLPVSSSTSGPDIGIFSTLVRQDRNATQMPLNKELPTPFGRHIGSSKVSDVRHTLANGDNQTVFPSSPLMASVLGRGAQTLRVRDVIHSAIEKNLQSSNSASANIDNLWQLYNQKQGPLLVPRSAVAADMPNESAQDLSCRNREPHSAAVKIAPLPQNCIGPHGVVGLLRAEKSPPPAHSHYGRLPAAVIPPPPPVIDRCQDPLYHLAEVAVQRGRVEVTGDRHHSSPMLASAAGYSGQPVIRPSIHRTELDRSIRGVLAPHAAGSITLGTPRHLVTGEVLSRPVVPAADVSHQNPLQHAVRVNDGLPTAPQVVELAQEALRYLGQPDSSQRAVMERVMAQVAGSLSSSNPSHNILMGDYVTAQQMQTSQYQQSTQPQNLLSQRYRHHQPLDSRTGLRDHVSSPRVPDLPDRTNVKMYRGDADVSVNHLPPVGPSHPHLPDRPQHPALASHLMRRPLTAANVIDAIITHQISKEAPALGTAGGSVVNRLPEPQVLSSNTTPRVVNVNGSVQPDSSIPSADARMAVYPPSRSIAEHVEKDHSVAPNSYAAFRNLEATKCSSSSVSVVPLVTRAVTLGEHIEKMIQKDFSISVHDNPLQMALEVSRNGMYHEIEILILILS